MQPCIYHIARIIAKLTRVTRTIKIQTHFQCNCDCQQNDSDSSLECLVELISSWDRLWPNQLMNFNHNTNAASPSIFSLMPHNTHRHNKVILYRQSA